MEIEALETDITRSRIEMDESLEEMIKLAQSLRSQSARFSQMQQTTAQDQIYIQLLPVTASYWKVSLSDWELPPQYWQCPSQCSQFRLLRG